MKFLFIVMTSMIVINPGPPRHIPAPTHLTSPRS